MIIDGFCLMFWASLNKFESFIFILMKHDDDDDDDDDDNEKNWWYEFKYEWYN